MPRPCVARHPRPEPDICPACRLYVNNPKYRRLWADEPWCAHLGNKTAKTIPCQVCPLHKVTIPVYQCAVFGECTAEIKIDGLGCCNGCPHGSYPKE